MVYLVWKQKAGFMCFSCAHFAGFLAVIMLFLHYEMQIMLTYDTFTLHLASHFCYF